MLTIGHAQKYASRATSLAYSSVILTPLSGPDGIARAQSGDGDNDCACESTGPDSISAIATAVVFMTALRERFYLRARADFVDRICARRRVSGNQPKSGARTPLAGSSRMSVTGQREKSRAVTRRSANRLKA